MSPAMQELARVQASGAAGRVSAVQVLTRYLAGMTRRGELLPGAAEKILPRVLDGACYPGQSLANLDAFLEGEGKVYLNPERPPADEPEAPLRAALRRFCPKDVADSLYKQHAAAAAESRRSPSVVARQILVEGGHAHWLGGSVEHAPVAAAPGPGLPKAGDFARRIASGGY